MQPWPISLKHLLFPIFVIVVSVVAWLLEPLSSEWFAFDRHAINTGQAWRLLSGHFLHTNTQHLLLNVSGLLLLWALHGQYYSPRWLGGFICLCAGTSVGIHYYSDLTWYVGLSGALHGLFILGAYWDIRNRYKTGWLLIIGIWCKVIYEQVFGASEQVASLIDASVAIDAHLFGTLSGTCLILLHMIKHAFETRRTDL